MGIIIASASEIRGEVPTGCQALMKMPVLLSIPLNPQAFQSGTYCRETRPHQLWDLGMFALCEESRSRLEERKAEGIEPSLGGRTIKSCTPCSVNWYCYLSFPNTLMEKLEIEPFGL